MLGKGGYYGNAFGYHDVTDTSDDAMLQPVCWITNAFDRSPAELIWVTSDEWGPLKGSLLNTSYGYGMFAWAGSRSQPGGFYRLRYTGRPVHLPVGLHTTRQGVTITFSGELDRETAENPANYSVKIWGLKRAASYGSQHYNERSIEVAGAALSADDKTVQLKIPEIEPTW